MRRNFFHGFSGYKRFSVIYSLRMNGLINIGLILSWMWITDSAPPLIDLDMFQTAPDDPCLNNTIAVKCVPNFENVAFGKTVTASSTCGSPPSRHCLPRNNENELRNCFICDSSPRRQYPAQYLTDLNNQNNETCWVSPPGIDYPGSVNLTLPLGKKFEITYLSLKFCSTVPDSMAFYKSKDYGKSWVPFHYFSTDCKAMYNIDPNAKISKANEQQPLCVQTSSKTRSEIGSRIAFSTLKDRPSSYHFEDSHVLQDWVTATDIKVVFNKLTPPAKGTMLKGEDPTDQMYYSVSDFAVGGRCKCNGHASECIHDKAGKLVCDCKHNTEGAECEKCKPFHYDRPWARATSTDAHECVGKSTLRKK